MKNRKLFAILTLVAFMMTLLPVAAFATPNRFASELEVDTSTVEAGDADGAEFTVYLFNDSNQQITGTDYVYVATNRGTTDVVSENNDDTTVTGPAEDENGYYYYTLKVDGGKGEFKITSDIPGDATVYVGTTPLIASYAMGEDVSQSVAGFIDKADFTVESAGVDHLVLDSQTSSEGVGVNPQANGLDYWKIKVQVLTESNAPIQGEEVKISANKSKVSFNTSSEETDRFGKAEFKVYATENGTYEIKAEAGDESVTFNLTFGAANAYDIKLAEAPDAKVKKETDADFKVAVTDINGNEIELENVSDVELEYEWLTVPDNVDDDDYSVITESVDDGKMKITVDGSYLDEEGTYELRVSLDNGKYVDVSWEAKEQGDITRIELDYDVTSIALGGKTDVPDVKRYDAEGVSATYVGSDPDFTFAASDVRMLLEEKRDIDELNGQVFATTDDDYTGTLTVTVVDADNDLTATADILIGKLPIAIELVAPEKVYVDEDVEVTVNVVDEDGKTVGFGDGADIAEPDFYVLSKPTGAIISTDVSADWVGDLSEKGTSTIEVSSNKAGNAKVQIIFKADGKTYAKVLDLNFGEVTPDVVYGPKNVTMFIGSTGYVKDGSAMTMDQAPFIQDGRTFVPVRMVGEALGAEVEYDAATQVITLTRPDMTITMTVGSNVLVKSDGTSVVSDVAPFIVAETGRTVIPFRAIAEAFGATVEAVFAADGTVTAVTFQQ